MKKQQGFALVQLVLGLVIVAAIGGVGYYVYSATNSADDSAANAELAAENAATAQGTKDSTNAGGAQSDAEGFTSEKSDGMYVVANSKFGFSFAYPEAFGELKSQDDSTPSSLRVTNPKIAAYRFTDAGFSTITTSYKEGVIGDIVLTVYDIDAEMTTRKYGPKVKLQNGEWIVTETSPSDVSENKVGDVYKDFNKKEVASESINGITVYVFENGDEGSESMDLRFALGDYIVSIVPASYNSGTYGNTDQTVDNSKEPFTELVQSVKQSIKKL
jgi:type II secretory pathway pseudopilin PulG